MSFNKILQILRVIRVGFLYSAFGVICLSGGALFMVFYIFKAHKFKATQRFCRGLVKISWAFFIWLCKICGYLRYKFDDLSFGESGELIIANHPSLLDVVFFLSKVPNLNCVVKGSLRQNIFLAPAIKCCGYILNSDSQAMLKDCCDTLKNGQALLIFPEGTRTKDEISFHKAAFFIAIKAAKKITAIKIDMSPSSLKKDQHWYDVPERCIDYSFKKIKSFDLKDYYLNRPDPIRVRLLQQEILEIYKELR